MQGCPISTVRASTRSVPLYGSLKKPDILFLAAGGGGALWYFKLRKPKSSVKGGDELDEFDFDEDDEAEEYGDYEDADSASDPDEQENEE